MSDQVEDPPKVVRRDPYLQRLVDQGEQRAKSQPVLKNTKEVARKIIELANEEPAAKPDATPPPKAPASSPSTGESGDPASLVSAVGKAEAEMRTYLPELWMPMRAALSTLSALRLQTLDVCPSCVFVGPSGVGKSTEIDLLIGAVNTERIDSITPGCFVSGSANVTEKDDVRKKDILPRMRHKGCLMRDFSTVTRQNAEQQKSLFGVFGPLFDARGYAPAFGTHGLRSDASKGNWAFAWIMASLPWPTQTWQAHGRFGSRLGFYNLYKSPGRRTSRSSPNEAVCR